MKVDRFSIYGRSKTLCSPKQNKELGELPVVGGLAQTPAEMARLVEQGIPVNAKNSQLTSNQGVANPSWDIPLERQSGTDIADIWNRQQEARQKLQKSTNTTKKLIQKQQQQQQQQQQQ
mgnify:FL=1